MEKYPIPQVAIDIVLGTQVINRSGIRSARNQNSPAGVQSISPAILTNHQIWNTVGGMNQLTKALGLDALNTSITLKSMIPSAGIFKLNSSQ